MNVRDVHLNSGDATELAEMLAFLSDWLDSDDHALLGASMRRYIASAGYDTAMLRSDLARFTFLLGGPDRGLFEPGSG